ncbi:hypothetical protein V2J09_003407 [Rumex salicifolius]
MAITISTGKCLSFLSPNAKTKASPPPIPIFISTDRSAVDLRCLSSLYSSCNHSNHRFPDPADPQPASLHKLGIAIAHSSIVVSVFTKPDDAGRGSFGSIWSPLSPENGRLVGFGRAVSDMGLTAAIYDVMVVPGLRRMGIGRLIVQRIVRMLTNKDVYDISALCSDQDSLFFKACGFGDDVLGSTTMMFGTSPSTHNSESDLIVKAGRRLLLAPPPRLPFNSQET